MIRDFIQAFRGKCLWNKLEKKYPAEKYLIMPHKNDEYNQYALEYLTPYMQKERAKSVMVISGEEGLLQEFSKVKEESYRIQTMKWSDKKIFALLKFYGLYEFSKKLTIVSLTVPYDTCGENLLGENGVTKRELLCYDIYRFDEIPEK